MRGKIGRPKTRMSRKVLTTSKSGRTYYRYVYGDTQVRRSRSPVQAERKPSSAREIVKKGIPMNKRRFEEKYPGKSYKKYREKLKRTKEKLT